MALSYPNIVEAMGIFNVIPETSVLAQPNASAGFNPVGAYQGVGEYRVSLTEERANKIAVVTPLNGIFVQGTTIDVNTFVGTPANVNIDIRVGGVAAAPVELTNFTIVVYNLPAGL